MSETIAVLIETNADSDKGWRNAYAIVGYFDGEPTLEDKREAYMSGYSGFDINDLNFYGDEKNTNTVDPRIHKPGIWRIELGGYV